MKEDTNAEKERRIKEANKKGKKGEPAPARA
jgi:hypothetical protein